MQVVVTSLRREAVPTVIMRRRAAAARREALSMRARHLMVTDGEELHAGDVMRKFRDTKRPRNTGGLPRVVSCSKLASRVKRRDREINAL